MKNYDLSEFEAFLSLLFVLGLSNEGSRHRYSCCR